MGYEKLFYYFTNNLNNEFYDNVNINNTSKKILTDYILVDMNFFLYNSIGILEKEINDIIKIIISIKHSQFKGLDINSIPYFKCINHDFLKDDLKNFNNELKSKINIVISDFLYYRFQKYILSLHNEELINEIIIFFDGLPSLSKILEQRKRKVDKFQKSLKNKIILSKINDFNNNIINEQVFDLCVHYNYHEWVKNSYSINIRLNEIITQFMSLFNNEKIKFDLRDGESDFKIFNYIKLNKLQGNITIYSNDSDFIVSICIKQLQNRMKKNNIAYRLIKVQSDHNFLTCINFNSFINILIDKYKKINNLNDYYPVNNYFIFDFFILINLFGNDVLPQSNELGIEIPLNIYFQSHYKLHKKNKFIFEKDKFINYKNLGIWLEELKKFKISDIILLNRLYKINYKTYLLLSKECDNVLNLVNNFNNYLNDKIDINPFDNYKFNNKDILVKSLTISLLKKDSYNLNLTNNNYENYYAISSFKNKKEKTYGNSYIDINLAIKSLLYILAHNFILIFNSKIDNSKTFYRYKNQPNLKDIILFLKENDFTFNYKKCSVKISSFSKYFITTPYLFNNKFKIHRNSFLIFLYKNIPENFWYLNNNFNLKNFDSNYLINIFENLYFIFFHKSHINNLSYQNCKYILY